MKLEFSRHFVEKYSNIKFCQNPSSVSRVVTCGGTGRRTERHDEANSRFSLLKSPSKCRAGNIPWSVNCRSALRVKERNLFAYVPRLQ